MTDRGGITLTADDETVLTGVMQPNEISASFSVWSFGKAAPGKYTLHIPYVYLIKTAEKEINICPELLFHTAICIHLTSGLP